MTLTSILNKLIVLLTPEPREEPKAPPLRFCKDCCYLTEEDDCFRTAFPQYNLVTGEESLTMRAAQDERKWQSNPVVRSYTCGPDGKFWKSATSGESSLDSTP
jgi:hypothetical protein